jgi:hypothetical protein
VPETAKNCDGQPKLSLEVAPLTTIKNLPSPIEMKASSFVFKLESVFCSENHPLFIKLASKFLRGHLYTLPLPASTCSTSLAYRLRMLLKIILAVNVRNLRTIKIIAGQPKIDGVVVLWTTTAKSLISTPALYCAHYFRHVIVPKDIAKQVPKNHLMTETEWRNIGIRQSPGWVHYHVHAPGENKFA